MPFTKFFLDKQYRDIGIIPSREALKLSAGRNLRRSLTKLRTRQAESATIVTLAWRLKFTRRGVSLDW